MQRLASSELHCVLCVAYFVCFRIVIFHPYGEVVDAGLLFGAAARHSRLKWPSRHNCDPFSEQLQDKIVKCKNVNLCIWIKAVSDHPSFLQMKTLLKSNLL